MIVGYLLYCAAMWTKLPAALLAHTYKHEQIFQFTMYDFPLHLFNYLKRFFYNSLSMPWTWRCVSTLSPIFGFFAHIKMLAFSAICHPNFNPSQIFFFFHNLSFCFTSLKTLRLIGKSTTCNQSKPMTSCYRYMIELGVCIVYIMWCSHYIGLLLQIEALLCFFSPFLSINEKGKNEKKMCAFYRKGNQEREAKLFFFFWKWTQFQIWFTW